MRALILLWAFILCLVAAGCQNKDPGNEVGPGGPLKTVTPGKSRFIYSAGPADAGADGGAPTTFTVPAGAYVTSFSCVAGASGATLVITASGAGITLPEAGPTISIPANAGFGLDAVVLTSTTLGAGSTLVFTGVASYTVTLYQAS